ncbi:MAG TPA: kelch repeat-containing protein [Anaeromyxobacteraceae bacterium]
MTPLRWTLLAVFLGMASACGGSSETPPSSGNWASRAPLPLPRADHAFVGLGGKLYALGGYSGSTLARVDRYDPASDAWTRMADMQSARREFAAGALNGKIYVACGMSWSNPNAVTYVTTTEEYDPVANTWTTRAPCPMDPAVNSVYTNVHIAGAAANGRLYVMVFNNNTAGLAATYEYDPGANTWATKAAPPFTYAHYSVAELGGTLYLLASAHLGGGVPAASEFARYDPVGDTWVIRQSLTSALGSALVGFGGKVYAVGGVRSSGGSWVAIRDVNRYDPATNTWSSAGQLGAARYLAAAATPGTGLYVAGGSSTGDHYAPMPLETVEENPAP